MTGAVIPIINILVGAACIVGGVTGKISLFGMSSSVGVVVAGSIGVGMGVFQLWRRQAR